VSLELIRPNTPALVSWANHPRFGPATGIMSRLHLIMILGAVGELDKSETRAPLMLSAAQ
jgi:hypothetical protein